MEVPKNKKYLIKGISRELIIILLVFVLSFIFVKEVRSQIDKTNEDMLRAKEANALREFYNETFEKYNKELANISEAEKIILSSLPPTEDMREFIGILNTLGVKNSVTTNVSIWATQSDNIKLDDISLHTVSLLINVSGSVENIRKYILEIEKLPYFFTITSVDEKSLDQASKQRSVIMNAKIWTKPEQSLTKKQP